MKKLWITVCFVAVNSVAQAQQVLPGPPEMTFKVTQDELNVISEGLQTQPFGKVAPLMNKLREQLIAQQPKPVAPPAVEPPKE